jgi:hypothetical protein
LVTSPRAVSHAAWRARASGRACASREAEMKPRAARKGEGDASCDGAPSQLASSCIDQHFRI